MWDILDRYPRAYLWSVLLHLALLLLVLVGVDWRVRSQNVGALENVIAARMTPSPEISRRVAELTAPVPPRPEPAVGAGEQAAAEQAREAERAQQRAAAEQARQAELARQQAAEAERLAGEEQARQEAAEQAARAAEQARQQALEQQRQAEARRRAEEETRRRVAAEAARRAAEAERQRLEAEERRRQAAEAERLAREEQAQQEAAEQAAQAAAAQALEAEREAQRQAAERARQQAAAEQRAAEDRRRAEAIAERERELAEMLAAEQARQAAQVRPPLPATGAEADAATRAAIVNRWVPAIQSRVRQFWVRPAGTDAGLTTVVSLQLNPGGDVVIGSVRVRESSGNAAFDQSVISAVYNASPLPVPDGAEFELFADFDLRFRP